MVSDNVNSGGSSPFLDSPMDAIPEEIPEIRTTNSILSANSNIISDDEKERKLISLEYKLSTLQNDYELERLQTQRQVNEMDKKYRSAIDELESSLTDTKFLHDLNDNLQEELNSLKKSSKQSETEKDDSINDLKLEMREKDQKLEDLQVSFNSHNTDMGYELENLKIEKQNVTSLVDKYNDEILKQMNEIKQLTLTINEKNDEILQLKNSQIVRSHPNYSTEEFQELSVMNKMFQDQVKYTKELEETNFKQADELKRFRNVNESVTFWKAENEKLQNKFQEVELLEEDYQTAQLEIVELKSKLTAFNVFSENLGNGKLSEINPEDIINDLELTKQENLVLIDENSKFNLNINNMKILNEELALERTQLLDLNKNYESNIINLRKLNYELEQQKILSFEECKLLRKQLEDLDEFTANSRKSNYDNDDKNILVEKDDVNKSLNGLVDEYKNRTDELTSELKKLNEQILTSQKDQMLSSKKRKTNDGNGLNYYSQRLNEMQLENVRLLRDLQKYQNLNKLLEAKLMKLLSLKEKKIRILQLRDNPLTKDQFVKRKQLQLLQQENQQLLEQLSENSELKTVPAAVYDALNFDIKQQESEIFKANKRFSRLKEVFNKKSLEFIEVVNSILGFKLEFRQDGKVKIYPCYMPEKYLVVDLLRNTLESNLNIENWDNLIKLWIEDRGQIPCFLATITLQLWDATQENKK